MNINLGELRKAYSEKFCVIQDMSENNTALLRITKGMEVYTLDVVEGVVEPLIMLENKFPGIEFEFWDEKKTEYSGRKYSSTMWVRAVNFDDAEIIS